MTKPLDPLAGVAYSRGMSIVYVISWRYGDGSGSGAVSVHETMEGAERMLKILDQHCDGMKTFRIEPVACERGLQINDQGSEG